MTKAWPMYQLADINTDKSLKAYMLLNMCQYDSFFKIVKQKKMFGIICNSYIPSEISIWTEPGQLFPPYLQSWC